MPTPAPPTQQAGLPLLAAAELQDHLLMVSHDLDRLQTLLGAACDTLQDSFHGATARLRKLRAAPSAATALATALAPDVPQALDATLGHLVGAVAALQFEDIASQLIAHTQRRLRCCVDQLAQHAFADDDEEDGPAAGAGTALRSNPVTQHEMDAGSVELF